MSQSHAGARYKGIKADFSLFNKDIIDQIVAFKGGDSDAAKFAIQKVYTILQVMKGIEREIIYEIPELKMTIKWQCLPTPKRYGTYSLYSYRSGIKRRLMMETNEVFLAVEPYLESFLKYVVENYYNNVE